ncbi:MAG: hypothetical protein JETT_1834 [Candidatus Jettenia ecosi]|uniref:Uncharacterized protein n=1 Tax=Candidatus Jettenia ecosi TaxID=2494326 RepID=A0A533QB09_9BACT|nr:MAG: hypothetical protein JETT_1834 [Candidatus Jettenia ecosi]
MGEKTGKDTGFPLSVSASPEFVITVPSIIEDKQQLFHFPIIGSLKIENLTNNTFPI